MSYRIRPEDVCETEGCGGPRAIGSDICARCAACRSVVQNRIAERPEEIARRDAQADRILNGDSFLAIPSRVPIVRAPRCVAYLSRAGDVITLELTGEPKFTEVDVALVADVLQGRRARGT